MGKVRVDRDSLVAAFPKALPVPPLLLEFAKWLEDIPHGSLGYFDAVAGESFRESSADPAHVAEMAAQLGLFLCLADGSRLALWDHGGAEPAVVLIGSEGDHDNVAPTLYEFLAALSRAETGVNDLDDDEGAPESRRAELGEWLESQSQPRGKAFIAKAPDFAAWFEAKLEGKEPPPEEPRPGVGVPGSFPMAEFSAKLATLVGRSMEDAALRAFVEALGHWPIPRFDSVGSNVYVEHKERGYCLIFRESKPAGVKPLAELNGCQFYPEGKDGYRAFAHSMPKGIRWSDSAKSLAPRLGPPSSEIKSKKTGSLTSQRWLEPDDPKRYVAVGYKQDGAIIDTVQLGVLPKVD